MRQNDVIGIIDFSVDVVVKYYYDAYGNVISTYDISGINLSSINPFRYRSYYYENEKNSYFVFNYTFNSVNHSAICFHRIYN